LRLVEILFRRLFSINSKRDYCVFKNYLKDFFVKKTLYLYQVYPGKIPLLCHKIQITVDYQIGNNNKFMLDVISYKVFNSLVYLFEWDEQ